MIDKFGKTPHNTFLEIVLCHTQANSSSPFLIVFFLSPLFSSPDFSKLPPDNDHSVCSSLVDNLYFLTTMHLQNVSETQLGVMFDKYIQQGPGAIRPGSVRIKSPVGVS